MVVHWRLIVRGGVWGFCPVAADHRKMYEGQSTTVPYLFVQNQRLSFVIVRKVMTTDLDGATVNRGSRQKVFSILFKAYFLSMD